MYTKAYLVSISEMLRHTLQPEWDIIINGKRDQLMFRHKGDKLKKHVLLLSYDEHIKIWYVACRSTYCIGDALHILLTGIKVAEISLGTFKVT